MKYGSITKDSRRVGMTYTIILLLLVTINVLFSSFASADDLDPHYKFSGIKAPDSPYKNTWGAYQTALFSGSFGYQYKIDVPPGTNGLTPNLTISYNNHSAKGKSGWVGSGWEIPLSYVQRDINYTRKDTSDDKFDLYLDGGKNDLIEYPASSGSFHTKIETYMKIEKKTGAPNTNGGEYWTATTKDGTEFRFGYNPDSAALVNSTDASFPKYVWRWSIDRIMDSNGNCVYFTYSEDPNPNDKGAVYLSKIEYNDEKKRLIEFILEPADKPDMYLTIDQGSEVQEARRLAEIRISVNGVSARKYKFAYTTNEIQTKSLLTTITQYGSDGVTALPPVTFSYKTLNKGFNEGVNWSTPGERWIRKTDGDNDTVVDTFDANGDGLPDLVSYDGDHWDVWRNTKSGFLESNLIWPIPSEWDIRDVEQHIEGQQSPDTRSAPMDLNNDGYIDFLWSDHTNVMQFKLNNSGSGFSETTYAWTLPISRACVREVIRPDNTNPNVLQDYSDMNGDGLPDLVKKENNTSWHIYRNTGSGFVDYGIWPVPHTDAWLEDYTTGAPTELQTGRYDINGDGLLDIVDAHSNPWKVYLNTGSDFLPAEQWSTSFQYINDTNSSGDVKRDLIDINGDGLPDIVNPVANVQAWEVYFNTGKGFTSKMTWTIPAEVPENGYINNVENLQVGREVLDLNGDGVPDLVRHIDGAGYWRVYSNKSGQADILTKVTESMGGMTTVAYEPSMGYANTRLPFNYWVVASITTNNGMTGAHALTSTTNYSYAKGLYHFPTREFRGFGEVTETRPDGSFSVHSYLQDEANKGKELKVEIKDSSAAPYSATENTWGATQSNGIYVTKLDKTDEYTYDGRLANPKLHTVEYQNYDAFGNVGLVIDYGDADVTGDELYTYSEYWPACSGIWNVDNLKHKYITSSAGGIKLRESFAWYDNSTSCVSVGNLTKEEAWLNTGAGPVTIYEYDSYGNRTKTIDPEQRITRTFFEATYHTFPETAYNAKNQPTTTYFNAVNGQPTLAIDPNGFTTSYAYDTFSRKMREVKPGDTDSRPTVAIEYRIDGMPPESVNVYTKDGTPTFDTVQFLDGFGNLIQTKQESESDMYKTAVDIFYDEMGRVKTRSNPYLTDSLLSYSTPDTTKPATAYDYDPLDRPVLITNADETQISRVFDHWSVSDTDENTHVKTYLFDAMKRLLQVMENNEGNVYTTNYQYSSTGELVKTTDHLGNITTLEYDSLGRKTKTVDPDLGTWTYVYDRVGNLTSQTDARGKITVIQYDPLNRKTLIDYPTNTDIRFIYDTNTIGTLSSVTDSAGTVNYQYDHWLRKTQEDRLIDGLTFITKWAYDSMDRPVTQIYPNGEAVSFNYNSQAKLAGIPGVINSLNYNAGGQVTQKNYANGRNTIYTYDSMNQRLTKISSSGIQDFSYKYDNKGNVSSITDAIKGRTENFTYDDLDRLLSAGDSGYTMQYQYNAVGNMLSMEKDGLTTTYTYGTSSSGPHAVKEVTSPLPVVGSFVVNNGNAFTTSNRVTLNNISYGSPTSYMVSEYRSFAGASWLPYSQDLNYLLSAGFGAKTVYFKVRNADGESKAKSDTIDFRLNAAEGFIDSDGDGLSNMAEYMAGTDATKQDTDGDTLGDNTEAMGGKSDPRKFDTNGDGISDSIDRFPSSQNYTGSSENYKIAGLFNEGGEGKTREPYAISRDSVGDSLVKASIQVVNHPSISATPAMLDFTVVKPGDYFSASITVNNSGTMGELTIGAITFTGEDSNEFYISGDTCTGQILPQGMTCKVQIVFSPTTPGIKDANILLPSNAPNTPSLIIPLIGAGADTADCAFSIVPEYATFTGSGGSGTITLTTGNSCSWKSASNDDWIIVNSGPSGAGTGQTSYSVAVNMVDSQRVGTLTSGGKTFYVIQAGGSCMYVLQPEMQIVGEAAGTGYVNITTGTSCNWTASSNNPSWLTITSGGSSEKGNGTFGYSYPANPGNYTRTGTVSVSGSSFKLLQGGIPNVPCIYPAYRGGQYATIQAAYDSAATDDTILINVLPTTEQLVFDYDLSITLNGGLDCAFEDILGTSTINGSLTITNGTVTIDNVSIK